MDIECNLSNQGFVAILRNKWVGKGRGYCEIIKDIHGKWKLLWIVKIVHFIQMWGKNWLWDVLSTSRFIQRYFSLWCHVLLLSFCQRRQLMTTTLSISLFCHLSQFYFPWEKMGRGTEVSICSTCLSFATRIVNSQPTKSPTGEKNQGLLNVIEPAYTHRTKKDSSGGRIAGHGHSFVACHQSFLLS